ncbi:hypothetical protein PHISCL_09572 [Aspergillus sclerotialis]|uniref:Uncharacterized protein n=1 Tax=Aspergillus sclerotialis TaxID=2070753 RepID=A0A3A2Z4U4_9EURO|nr:hypothetical protein PHISCL_09572 [Aspergillus sclerotialis]
MKFDLSPVALSTLLVTLLNISGKFQSPRATAQATATGELGSTATEAPNSSGCGKDGYCWGSCIPDHSAPDYTIEYKPGGNWCWLVAPPPNTDPKDWPWARCDTDDDCDLLAHNGQFWCDISKEGTCGPS